MDKFEQIIKQAVEGYEAPFDPQAWENVSNELGDSFDQMMKESTSGYEAPYNPAAWDAVSSQLGPAYSAWKWIGGSAAAVALIAGISFFVDSSEPDTNQPTNYASSEVVVHNDDLADNIIISDDGNVYEAENNNVDADQNVLQPIDLDLNDNGTDLTDQNVNDQNDNLNNDVVDNQNDQNNNSNDQDNHNNNDQVDNNGQNNDVNDQNDQADDGFKATANFRMSTDEVCVNGSCDFSANDDHPSCLYVWSFGDGTYSNEANPSHSYKKAGEYNVTLVIKNSRTYEILASNTEMIVVHELPEAEISLVKAIDGIPTYSFSNKAFDSEVVLWNVKGLKQSTNEEFEHTFRKKGTYTVSLITKNDQGCTNKVEEEIDIEDDYNLTNQTAFSPDGDGQYDNFIPKALQLMGVDFTMTIMDKTGKLVYTTQNAFEPWDGRFTEDNTLAPSGSSYIWRVVLINNNGEQEFYEGQIFVIY